MKLFILLLLLLLLLTPFSVIADICSGSQPKPKTFSVNVDGEIFGILEYEDNSTTTFSQINMSADSKLFPGLGPRLQKFQWLCGSWYVSDKGAIEADYDIQAFSIYLTL